MWSIKDTYTLQKNENSKIKNNNKYIEQTPKTKTRKYMILVNLFCNDFLNCEIFRDMLRILKNFHISCVEHQKYIHIALVWCSFSWTYCTFPHFWYPLRFVSESHGKDSFYWPRKVACWRCDLAKKARFHPPRDTRPPLRKGHANLLYLSNLNGWSPKGIQRF